MSAELQPALQVTTPHGALDGHILLIFGIMVVMGILGGVANFYLADRHGDAGRRDWAKYPVFGVVAALTVPLFLNMISSTLLEGARTKPIDYYVFAGFCLLYVVASRRLFENMVQQADRVALVIVRAEAVGADQFGQTIALMGRRGGPAAPHFGEAHADTAPAKLPGRFTAGEPAADNMHIMRHSPRLALASRAVQGQAWAREWRG